jgi:amino acid adenylation domain-containing protein
MSTDKFLADLLQKGVQLWVENNELCFRAPAGAITPPLREEMSERKAEIMAFLGKDRRYAPASFAQQRLWFLDRSETGSSAPNIVVAYRLGGLLDVVALEQSLNEIVRRHKVLRTTFATVDGRAVQVIASSLTVTLPLVDLQQVSKVEQQAQGQWLIAEEGQWAFDLTNGPLVRATLLQLGEKEHVLLLTVAHIVFDSWSVSVLVRELEALYRAFSAGKPSPLPELPIQYADLAVWQHEQLQGEGLEKQLSCWKQQPGGDLPVLELPTDWPRPPVQTHRWAVVSRELPETLGRGSKALSRQEGSTLFTTLLAAFEVLLHRYTGQEDILVGSSIANRNRRELEGLIGPLANTLMLRTDLSGNPPFREVLGRVREATLNACAHQDLPFETSVEELQPQRDSNRVPPLRVFFGMPGLPDNEMELPGLVAENLSPPEVGSEFDLTLHIDERKGRIHFSLVFNTDLFARHRIVEMLEQFQHLLSQIVENPEERLARFSLVTPAAQEFLPEPTLTLGADWKGAVHTLFSHQARQAPERPAVMDQQEAWTYGELETRSNQLANYLRESGIQSQDIVAIYGHRSASLVWAVLGVLRAGAAFLILAPAYPAARLITCLQVAQPRGWLQVEAAGELPDALEEFVATSAYRCRLRLPHRTAAEARGLLEDYPADDPGAAIGPDDLAYVAFTSGSTGAPKGILGRHGPLSHFLPWQKETFELRSSDRYSMLSGLSHDPLQRDIFTPLALGAALCIPDPEQIGTPGWLAQWMRREEISVTHLTPAMVQLLTQTATRDARPIAEIPSLRYAFIVGDALTRQDVSRLQKLAPAVTCVNLYGATETQRAVGYFVVPRDKGLISKEIIPLGRGIQDAQLLVLNASQGLAGVGELGEIYVRSPHLARGYLGDDALTQERFIINPFTRMPGDRLYKTGDLGRYLPDGNVEFQGRADYQVKIRGFRIEPGEIETLLAQHPGVRETVVIAREDRPGDRRLVAYVVATGEQGPTVGEMRRFLEEKLPGYMVPSAFVLLEALPLTPNNKVDRRALPAPENVRPELAGAFVAPCTPVEEVLAGMWAQVLGIERVGIHDNFFELGGHSLLATQIVSRVRDTFQVELPLRSLFEGPNVAVLAASIEVVRGAGGELPAPPIVSVSREGPISHTHQAKVSDHRSSLP